MENAPRLWLCSYDSAHRLFTLINTDNSEGTNPGWVTLIRDDKLSDPDGNFTVFFGTDVMWQMPNDMSSFPHVKVEIKSDKSGNPITTHKEFNHALLGSPTLYGPSDLYERDRNDFIWFTSDKSPLWAGVDTPTHWE